MYNQELIEKVEDLRAKRIIKKDVDICASTGFSNTVVSNYLKGKVKASRNFIDKFEVAYGVKIFEKKLVKTDFKDNMPSQTAALMDIVQANKLMAESILKASEAQLIDAGARKVLIDNNTDLTKFIKSLIGKPAMSDPELIQVLNANMRGLLAAIAKVATGARFESEDVAVSELGKIVHEKHRKQKAKGNLSGVGN